MPGRIGVICFLQVGVIGIAADKNTELKKQLEKIQYEPGRLLGEGRIYLEKSDYENAKRIINSLFKKHPTSAEAGEAKTLYAKIEQTQLEQDKK